MNINEIASSLVAYCRKGNFQAAQQALYAEDAVSFEPQTSAQPVTRGLEGIRQKGIYFQSTLTVHGIEVSEPLIAGRFFSLRIAMDVTVKENGQRMIMEEVCVYEVKDGKIQNETFYY
ncbi:MAG: nuclear transport factor 2 family protein [Chloroherpetonaceae bacterium]|nr:nuclear transport factor 2 family protein [Chloroherpetonaceae bacterium]